MRLKPLAKLIFLTWAREQNKAYEGHRWRHMVWYRERVGLPPLRKRKKVADPRPDPGALDCDDVEG